MSLGISRPSDTPKAGPAHPAAGGRLTALSCPKNPRGRGWQCRVAAGTRRWRRRAGARGPTRHTLGLGGSRSRTTPPGAGAEASEGGGRSLCSSTWTAMCSAPPALPCAPRLPRAPPRTRWRPPVPPFPRARAQEDKPSGVLSCSLTRARPHIHIHILLFRLSQFFRLASHAIRTAGRPSGETTVKKRELMVPEPDGGTSGTRRLPVPLRGSKRNLVDLGVAGRR